MDAALKVADKCEECAAAGFDRKLCLFWINSEEQILKCEDGNCLWPHNDEISSDSEDEEIVVPTENDVDNYCDEDLMQELLDYIDKQTTSADKINLETEAANQIGEIPDSANIFDIIFNNCDDPVDAAQDNLNVQETLFSYTNLTTETAKVPDNILRIENVVTFEPNNLSVNNTANVSANTLSNQETVQQQILHCDSDIPQINFDFSQCFSSLELNQSAQTNKNVILKPNIEIQHDCLINNITPSNTNIKAATAEHSATDIPKATLFHNSEVIPAPKEQKSQRKKPPPKLETKNVVAKPLTKMELSTKHILKLISKKAEANDSK